MKKKHLVPQTMTDFSAPIEAAVDAIRELANTNSVLSEPVSTGDTTVIPISRLSIGFAGGGSNAGNQPPLGGGAKLERTPAGAIVLQNGKVRIVPMPNGTGETGGKESLLLPLLGQFLAKRQKKNT